MPREIAAKVITDSRHYPIERIDVGESGDAFLNPDMLDILRLIRASSTASLRLFTNFSNFDSRLVDAVVEENLLDEIVTNIDGATPATYRAVKGLNLERVEANILYFLERRNQLSSPIELRIQSLTLNRYVATVRRVLGRDPLYVDPEWLEVEDDFEQIVARWTPRGVVPVRSIVALWGEWARAGEDYGRPRGLARRIATGLRRPRCRLLDRIERSLFVAPSGEIYLCCADFDFELIVGDVTRRTVREVVESDRRHRMIASLRARRFEELGGPCSRHHLCQLY